MKTIVQATLLPLALTCLSMTAEAQNFIPGADSALDISSAKTINPQAARSDDGTRIGTTWLRDIGPGSYEVCFRLFDGEMTPLNTPQVLGSSQVGSNSKIDIISLSTGEFVVVQPTNNSPGEVVSHRIDKDTGNLISSSTFSTTNDFLNYVDSSPNNNGGYVVCFNDGTSQGVIQEFDSTSSPVGSLTPVTTETGFSAGRCATTITGYMLATEKYIFSTDTTDIRFVQFDANLTTMADEQVFSFPGFVNISPVMYQESIDGLLAGVNHRTGTLLASVRLLPTSQTVVYKDYGTNYKIRSIEPLNNGNSLIVLEDTIIIGGTPANLYYSVLDNGIASDPVIAYPTSMNIGDGIDTVSVGSEGDTSNGFAIFYTADNSGTPQARTCTLTETVAATVKDWNRFGK